MRFDQFKPEELVVIHDALIFMLDIAVDYTDEESVIIGKLIKELEDVRDSLSQH